MKRNLFKRLRAKIRCRPRICIICHNRVKVWVKGDDNLVKCTNCIRSGRG